MSRVNPKALLREVAVRENHGLGFGNMNYLPNPDPILKKMGRSIEAYNSIRSDTHVAGCIRRRKAAVKAQDWRITTTDDEFVTTFITELFDSLSVNKIITEILNAPLYGYQPLEINWHYENGFIVPKGLVAKPAEWFLFDAENKLRFKSKKEPMYGELVAEDKFILATQDASYDNPYGRSDLSLCFWPAVFKKGGLKYWFEFVDKYGSPAMYAKMPRNATPDEEEKALDALEMLRSSSVGTFPVDSEVVLLDSANKGASSTVFDDFMRYVKSEISVAILGQDQTTEADSNRASATAGLEVLEDIRKDDESIVVDVFNKLIRLVAEKNLGDVELPTFEFYEQESVDTIQAERDTQLTSQGVRFTKAYYMKTYGLEEEDIEEITPNTPQMGSPFMFNEPQRETQKETANGNILEARVDAAEAQHLELESATDQLLLAIQDGSPIDDWLKPILDTLTSNDPAEASDKLAELFPLLDAGLLEEKLTNLIFVSELWGRLSAQRRS